MPAFTPGEINITLIITQVLFSAGLRLLLEKTPGMRVLSESRTMDEAIKTVTAESPDIIVLDLDRGKQEALELLTRMRKVANGAKVVLLASKFDPEVYGNAVYLGVKGFVTKEQSGEVFIKAIRKVYSGEVWLDRVNLANVIDHISDRGANHKPDPEQANISLLTRRELEIIRLVSKALKNREIAECLLISEATVRHHLTSIFNKLNVSDRFDLVLYAFHHSLVDPP
jgi:DNA-binding NarL/FixJ family response regulator